MIEFLCEPDLVGKIPEPQRSNRFMPEWFRALDRKILADGPEQGAKLTVKACMPVTDVYALGFILPLAFDVTLIVSPDCRDIQAEWDDDCPFNAIEPHEPAQIGAFDPPFERAVPMKFVNPWRIKVPDGFSVLFTPPLSHPELPFLPFSGLVDCDCFATNVNIPFLWNGPTGRQTIPAGTPIAQCVPIARETMVKEYIARAADESELSEQAAANARKYGEKGAYAKDWRVRK